MTNHESVVRNQKRVIWIPFIQNPVKNAKKYRTLFTHELYNERTIPRPGIALK